MLRIRAEQLERLREARYDAFLKNFRSFLTAQLPDQVEMMGDDALDALTRLSFSRATALDLDTEREHLLFGVFSVLFGAFFDADPQYPWAIDRLTRPGLRSAQRIDLFRARADLAITEIEASRHRIDPLGVLTWMDATTLAFGPVDASSPLIDWYSQLFPAHASWMRAKDLEALAQRARALASACNLLAPNGEKLVIAAMGMLGAGFADDPQFQPLAAVLSAPMPSA